MFDFPLPECVETLYESFGLGPEASPEEIRDAETEAVVRLTLEKRTVEKELAAVNAAVPGLAEARTVFQQLQTSEENSQASEVAEARKRLALLEEEALRANPRFRDLLKRAHELERRNVEINGNPIKDPKKRKAYDESHPPLGLLKLADCAKDSFVDNRLAIHLVRSELSRYLADQGENIHHPSDLSRDDFSGDFTPNSYLDDLSP